MSLLNDLFNIDIKTDIKYTPINTNKIDKKLNNITNKLSKDIENHIMTGYKNILFNNHKNTLSILYNSDIYKKCKNEAFKHLEKCCDVMVENVYDDITIPKWFDNYWLMESNCKKYNKQQLKHIEKLFIKGNSSADICISIYCSVLKEMLHGYKSDYILQEKDIFKIKNRMRGI